MSKITCSVGGSRLQRRVDEEFTGSNKDRILLWEGGFRRSYTSVDCMPDKVADLSLGSSGSREEGMMMLDVELGKDGRKKTNRNEHRRQGPSKEATKIIIIISDNTLGHRLVKAWHWCGRVTFRRAKK